MTSANAVTITSGALTVSAGNIVLTEDNLKLPQTVSSSTGVVTVAGNPFIHSYGAAADDNTFVGQSAGNFTLTSGTAQNNSGFGYQALNGLTTANNCTAVGNTAGSAITTGVNNTAFGSGALSGVTTGARNTCIGFNAGSNYTSSEASNIQIGAGVTGTASESHVLRIGSGTGTSTGNIAAGSAIICGIYGAGIAASNPVYMTSANVIGTNSSLRSTKKDIEDCGVRSDVLYDLKAKSYRMIADPDHLQFGFIAEDVEEVDRDLCTYDAEGNLRSVAYASLVPMLINEIQKLERRVKELESK